MNLNWSEGNFSLSHVIEKTVQFPQLLRVELASGEPLTKRGPVLGVSSLLNTQQPVNNNGNLPLHISLKDGDVLKLHGILTFKKVIVTGAGSSAQTSAEQVANEYGYLSPPGSTTIHRQFSLPVGLSLPLQILPYRGIKHVYSTAGDLIQEQTRPSAVTVNKTISLPEKNCVIKEGDILAILSVDKRCTSTGVVDFLICKHNDKTIGLPTSCVGNFTAVQDESLFTLDDLANKHIDIGLPQKICFQPRTPNTTGKSQTLVRGGEHHIVPGNEYVAENIIKQQYLICTKCGNSNTVSDVKVYFIPTNCPSARHIRVRLPLFYDLNSYKQTLSTSFCPNLSMRNILDATPIEYTGEPEVIVRKLSDVYNMDNPQLPPRTDILSSDPSK